MHCIKIQFVIIIIIIIINIIIVVVIIIIIGGGGSELILPGLSTGDWWHPSSNQNPPVKWLGGQFGSFCRSNLRQLSKFFRSPATGYRFVRPGRSVRGESDALSGIFQNK